MARGNQRENDRKKSQKKMAGMVQSTSFFAPTKISSMRLTIVFLLLQKSKNTMTGSEQQRAREDVAAKMREKQKAGW
ncbi:4F5 domain protein [Aspergillus ruber CBS 135680]|uniref:Small EDRK-rich factor-like N-terminal domain-containing protein n=1 Tax=Aspergillus ruber (strain CBS 135680) TaxID=1388766 RepID=A0A017SLL3_ASPRC|nr:uncharacterized protein EURHEDRAFT_409117 [Aspergillus ruber CBS 135680]EYE97842.1 hypothetical protein EURHEDRAFT_409117 [Aspergillus ruber CBS 135680]